jgi:hypothetical protein
MCLNRNSVSHFKLGHYPLLRSPLHAHICPVDLKIRGFARFIWRCGCVPVAFAGMVTRRNGF